MALTMLFPSGGAVDPFEAEEAILHENRMRDRRRPTLDPFHKLVTTTGMNVVGSIAFRHLRQLALTHRASSIDRLFPRAVEDFKVSPTEWY
jgi:hypothetical protein